jgi:hypothetical protein
LEIYQTYKINKLPASLRLRRASRTDNTGFTLLFFAAVVTKGELSEYQVIRRAGYQGNRKIEN